jgi:hypothetical protein
VVAWEHELKTDSDVFAAVLDGSKTHEIRRNDRDFKVGDTLRLRETRYTGQEMRGPEPRPLVYTGRECTRVISHVLEGYGLQPGWVILSFAAAPTPAATAPAALTDEAVRDAERYRELRRDKTLTEDSVWIARGGPGPGISRWVNVGADQIVDAAIKSGSEG